MSIITRFYEKNAAPVENAEAMPRRFSTTYVDSSCVRIYFRAALMTSATFGGTTS